MDSRKGASHSFTTRMNNNMTSSSEDDDDSSYAPRRLKRDTRDGIFASPLMSCHTQGPSSSSYATQGNPKYGNEMLLFSRTGYHLKLTPDGQVLGSREENDPYAIMEIISAGIPGHIMIRGKKSHLYVAMKKNGRLYGETDWHREQTKWLEELLGSYNTYMSRSYAHLGWYLGIKKSGKPKRGQKTSWGQKATQFLPRRTN